MRFKQIKPQHVKKKEKNSDSLDVRNGTISLEPEVLHDSWNSGDCVDGDVSAASLEQQALLTSVQAVARAQNGHITVMDMKPMLELYTSEDCNESKPLPAPPTPRASENDSIIQGRRPIFSETEELNIAAQLKLWKNQGMKYTRLDVVKMASEYAVQLGKRPEGRPLTVKWFRSFLTRHPECYIRKSRQTKSEQPEKQYFNQLDTILSTYSLKESPHCIFSLVELPLSIFRHEEYSEHGLNVNGSGVNGVKGHNKLKFFGKVPSSVLLCGSAAGQAMPPFLLFAGKSIDKASLSGLTPGAGAMAWPSGRVTAEVLVSFLRDHFLTLAPGRAGDTLVLLLDASLTCSLSQAVFDLGSAFKVVFVTADATLSPQLHPMVVGCCDAFQRELGFELQKPLYSPESTSLTSASVCEFLCKLYHRSMSAENLHSSFRKAGIYPFNPSVCRKRYGLATISFDANAGQSSKSSLLGAKNLTTNAAGPQKETTIDSNKMDDDQNTQ